MPLTLRQPHRVANYSEPGPRAKVIKLERPTVVVVPAVVTTIASIALKAFLISAQETIAISLLELIRIIVPSQAAIIAVSVAVEMRALWIVVLAALSVARARIQSVLITLVDGDLTQVTVTTIASVAVVAAIVSITAIRILAIRPLSLHSSARGDSDAHEEKQWQYDSPEFVSEIV